MQVLVCRCDTRNRHDPLPLLHVKRCKGTIVVGQVPRRISAICYAFLGKPGTSITCSVILALQMDVTALFA